MATWSIHIQESHSHHLSSAFTKVARRASANLVRRKRVYKQNLDPAGAVTQSDNLVAGTDPDRKESDDSMVFYPGAQSFSLGVYSF